MARVNLTRLLSPFRETGTEGTTTSPRGTGRGLDGCLREPRQLVNDEIQATHRNEDQLSWPRSGRDVSAKSLVRPVFLVGRPPEDRSSHFAVCTGLGISGRFVRNSEGSEGIREDSLRRPAATPDRPHRAVCENASGGVLGVLPAQKIDHGGGPRGDQVPTDPAPLVCEDFTRNRVDALRLRVCRLHTLHGAIAGDGRAIHPDRWRNRLRTHSRTREHPDELAADVGREALGRLQLGLGVLGPRAVAKGEVGAALPSGPRRRPSVALAVEADDWCGAGKLGSREHCDEPRDSIDLLGDDSDLPLRLQRVGSATDRVLFGVGKALAGEHYLIDAVVQQIEDLSLPDTGPA